MNKYELVYIIDAALEDEARKAVIDRFNGMIEQNGGKVLKVDEWGKRRLAYPINDKPEGYYVLVNFKSSSDLPSEMERIFGITEGIMRSIVIRHEDKKPRAKKAAPAKTEA